MIEKAAKKKILFISAAVALLAVFIGVAFIYGPFISRKVGLRNRIIEERKRNLYLAQIKILKEHVNLYEERLPEQKSLSLLLDEVSRLASESGLEIISIKPEPPEDKGRFIKFSIRLKADLTYHRLGSFLSKFESSKKFIKIENIQLRRVEEAQEEKMGKAFKVSADILVSSIILKD